MNPLVILKMFQSEVFKIFKLINLINLIFFIKTHVIYEYIVIFCGSKNGY